uniref:Tetratricopeptide repeat protein 29 n=1 Tax=Strigamia maritima TaxID=126957 RepID=T1JNN2_STRMM
MAKISKSDTKFHLPPLSKDSLSSESVRDLEWNDSDIAILSDDYEQIKLKRQTAAQVTVVRKKARADSWRTTEPLKLPNLNKRELDKRTYPPKHNFCLELIKDGFPNSFVEFFNIFNDMEALEQKKIQSIDETISKPTNNLDKLSNLSKYLSKAEDAERKRLWIEVYQSRKFLATYFAEKSDMWLTYYFYNDCLKVAKKITNDGGKRLAEANGFMGLYYEHLGLIDKAAEHFRIMHKMSDKQTWQNVHYKPMHAEAAFNIAKMYLAMADEKEEEGDMAEAFKLYLKALTMTKTANDRGMMVHVYLKLGRMYMNRNEVPEALSCYRHVEKMCKEIGEFKGLCKTYQSMAEVCTNSGRDEEARDYLKKFAYTAERHNMSEELIKASYLLGKVYSTKHQNYTSAWQSFSKSFTVAQRLENVYLGDNVRVNCGIALANSILERYTATLIRCNEEGYVETLLDWKLNSNPNAMM